MFRRFREGSLEAMLLKELTGDGPFAFVSGTYLQSPVRRVVASLDRAEAMRLIAQGGNGRISALAEHPDGRVREAALRALEPDPSSSLAALLRRANDWVPVVARLAGERAAAALAPADDRTLLEALPLIFALTRQSRADHRRLVFVYLREVERRPGLAKRIRRAYRNGPAGEWAATYVVGADESPTDRLRETLGSGPPKARLETARRVAAQPGMWQELIGSRNAHVRRLALDHAPPGAVEAALTDLDAWVRSDARHLLGDRDFAAHYRERLPAPGAVSGLGETGTAADAASLRPLLASPNVGVRNRALEAVFRLVGDDAEADLLTALRDPSRKVQRTAAECLVRSNLAVDPEASIALDLNPGVKRALLGRASRWAALNAVLRAMDRLPEGERSDAERWIGYWARRSHQIAIAPRPEEAGETRLLLTRAEGRMAPAVAAELRAAVAYWLR